jgi:uncharacterized protein
MKMHTGRQCRRKTKKGYPMSKMLSIALMLMLICSCFATGIHKAVFNNDLDEVRSFVNEGKANERQGSLDQTPLLAAAYYDNKKIVQYLCNHGADVNARDKKGQTALIYAANYGYYELAGLLLRKGADVDLKDQDGHSALYYAKYSRYYRIVDILEDNGASLQ